MRTVFELRNLAKLHGERDSEEGYAEAASLLGQITAMPQADFDDHLNLARALVFVPGRAADALAALTAAKGLAGDTDRSAAALAYVEGLYHKRVEDSAAALAAFERVLQHQPDIPQALYQAGQAAEAAERDEDAARHYRGLIDRRRLLRAASYRLSRVYTRLGRADDAAAALAVFQAEPDIKFETERCELTQVQLRPGERRPFEPPPPALRFQDATDRLLGAAPKVGLRRVVPFRGADGVELLCVGSAGATIVTPGGESRPMAAGELGDVASAAVGDIDNDGDVDVLLATATGLRLFEGAADGSFTAVAVPLSPAQRDVVDSRLFDVDHDGDLDFVCIGAVSGRHVYRNNGDNTFEHRQPFGDSPRVDAHSRFDAHDFDRANDLDFVFPAGGRGAIASLNLRDEQFRAVELGTGDAHGVLLAEDFTNDGAPDVFAAGGGAGWSLFVNDAMAPQYRVTFEAARNGSLPDIERVFDASAVDFDSDGDLDVLLATDRGLVPLRNSAGGELRAEPIVEVAGAVALRDVDVADLTNDSRPEVLVITAAGAVRVLEIAADPAYAALTVELSGKRDNERGVGAIVEAYVDRQFQSVMQKRPLGLHLGLGVTDVGELDGLFVRWPQGIRQSDLELAGADTGRIALTQREGLVASCPFLYGHGVDGWQFLTDVIGIAPLDEWLPPGQSRVWDPEEFIRVDGDALAIEDGRVRLTITEELRETAYVDRVDLRWVDHPTDIEVLIDGSSRHGQYDPLEGWTVPRESFAPLATATLGDGDVTQLVRERDRVFLHGYDEVSTQWAGWVPRYSIDLTLGEPATMLLLSGRIAWYDSTVVYSITQHGRTWGPLQLFELGADGSERLVCEDVGFPAGMDRTIVVTLGNEPLPAGTVLRLSAHHRFLWDQIQTANGDEPWRWDETMTGRPDQGVATLERAELGYHGYSALRGDKARHEHTYDYDDAGPDDYFPTTVGSATRYGDVEPLLAGHDDLLVTLAPGDRVELTFAVEPIAAGMRRTWFVRISGWAKEASYHNRTGREIGPLPFRAMKRYPFAADEGRSDTEYRDYLEKWQTRVIPRDALRR